MTSRSKGLVLPYLRLMLQGLVMIMVWYCEFSRSPGPVRISSLLIFAGKPTIFQLWILSTEEIKSEDILSLFYHCNSQLYHQNNTIQNQPTKTKKKKNKTPTTERLAHSIFLLLFHEWHLILPFCHSPQPKSRNLE